jgi:hypothetical protein
MGRILKGCLVSPAVAPMRLAVAGAMEQEIALDLAPHRAGATIYAGMPACNYTFMQV